MKRLAVLAVVALGLTVIAVLLLRPLQATSMMRVSPYIDMTGKSYDEDVLTTAALNQAAMLGISGETTATQAYLITYGQWLAFNSASANFDGTDGSITRQTAVFVLEGTGIYSMGASAPQDRITIAIFAGTGRFVGFRTFPPGAPRDVVIDVNQPDGGNQLVPQTLIPLAIPKQDRRATRTAAALTMSPVPTLTPEATEEPAADPA